MKRGATWGTRHTRERGSCQGRTITVRRPGLNPALPGKRQVVFRADIRRGPVRAPLERQRKAPRQVAGAPGRPRRAK
jgi:hypothetical protein